MCDCNWFNSYGNSNRDYLSPIYGVGEVDSARRGTYVIEYIDESTSPLKGTVNGVDTEFTIITQFVTTHDFVDQSITYRSALSYEACSDKIKYKSYKLYFRHNVLGGPSKYYVFESLKEPTKTIDGTTALTLCAINKKADYDNDAFQVGVSNGYVYGFTENEFGMLIRNNIVDTTVKLPGSTIVSHLFGATSVGLTNSKLVAFVPTSI